MVWQVAVTHPDELVRRRYDPLRRTHGFLSSVPRLAKQESRHFQ